MAHNLAHWTARTGLGEQVVTTKTLRRRFFSLAGHHPLGPSPHPASSPALALGNPIQSRPGSTASHSTPGLTAPSATELPTAQPNSPQTRATLVRERFLPCPLSSSCPRAHRRPPSAPPRAPAGRPATSRLPESSPDNRACNSLTPFRCPHAVHRMNRWIRANPDRRRFHLPWCRWQPAWTIAMKIDDMGKTSFRRRPESRGARGRVLPHSSYVAL